LTTKKHLVIGDLILDRFIYGHANRISAEAPTLVLDVDKEIDMLGGAYNVAAHIAHLGHQCNFASVVGKDFEDIYPTFNDKFHPNTSLLLLAELERHTSVKTRLISEYKNTHLLRFDYETVKDISENNQQSIVQFLNNPEEFDAILLIDYKKGVITKNLAEKVIEIANSKSIPVFVDTKRDDLSWFRNATIIKPNKYEFEKIRLRYAPDCSMEDACGVICEKLNISNIVITAGNEGIFAYNIQNKLVHYKAEKVEAKELSGAGDSVLAVLSYCLSEGYSFESAVVFANKLAAKFVSSGIQYRAKKEDLFG